jgi:hypothetical protein
MPSTNQRIAAAERRVRLSKAPRVAPDAGTAGHATAKARPAAKPKAISVSAAEYKALSKLNQAAGTNIGGTRKPSRVGAAISTAGKGKPTFSSVGAGVRSGGAGLQRAHPFGKAPARVRDRSLGGVLQTISGIRTARAVGSTIGAIGDDIIHHPGEAASKSLSTAGELAKGVASVAALAPYAVTYPADVIGSHLGYGDAGESPLKIGGRIVNAEADRISKTYGPSFYGDKGAYAQLKKSVKKTGPLLPALDVATVVAPVSSGLGKVAREGVAGERIARAVSTRPGTRYGFTDGSVKDGRVRKSALGQSVAFAHDTARRGAQKVAVKRASPALKAKAEAKPLSRAGLAHKPLSPRRATLKDGEVTPVLSARATRNLRFKVAEGVTKGETAARIRVRRFVTGKTGVVQASRSLPAELRDLPEIAKQLGIRDAAGARAIIPLRLKEIETRTAEALAGKGLHAGRDAAAAHTAANAAEADRLRELLAHPEVFDRADVRAVTEHVIGVQRKAVTGREGLSEERAAGGRSGDIGETLGVERASATNAAAKAEHDAARALLNRHIDNAVGTRAAVRAEYAPKLAKARADLEHAKGRAEVLSRNVTGRNTLGPRDAKYAAGGHGVREAQAALDKVKAEAEAHLGAAHDAVQHVRSQRKALNQTPVKRVAETNVEYEARVAEAAKAHGLAAPEYADSRYAAEAEFRVQHPRSDSTPANPLGKTNHGTNYRLGRQAHDPEQAAASLRRTIERGARVEAEQEVLAKLGMYFPDQASAATFLKGLGIASDDVALIKPTSGVVRKDMASAHDLAKGKDHGDYVTAHGVFAVDKVVKQELDALSLHATQPARILHLLALGPQAALLALSPSWFLFQRVNDLIGAAAGGSLPATRSYGKQLKALDEDSQEIAAVMSGGSVSTDFLTPRTGQKLGRMQRVLDENPTYSAAFDSDAPATNLLMKFAHDGPTALLRADAKITGKVRERQFIHNLQKIAAKMDPDVAKVYKGFAPFGHALKTGDVQLLQKLLKDPKYAKARDEAAASLNRVMGDWHNYTAGERSLKSAFAFYGFLRYSTRMALYTLPVDHPYVGMLIAQLGAAGTEDARNIIGDDLPYGFGKLYHSDGTIAADLTRANPLVGPLTQITKPEQVLGLATPLASIMLSVVTGQKIGLSDSASGYVKQFTVNKDPKDHSLGGFTSDQRLRILGDQVLSLLSPYKAWKNWDTRAQSDDSLPFDRRYLEGATGAERNTIAERNANRATGGARGVLRQQLPLLAPSDGRNYRQIGKDATAGAEARRTKEELRKDKRYGATRTPLGKAQAKIDEAEARLNAKLAPAEARIAAAEARLNNALARKGISP